MSDYPFQVTVKPPANAASAPWLNFQGQSVDEVKEQILEVFPGTEFDSFAELVSKVYVEYGAVLSATVGLAAPVAPQAASIQSDGPAPQWAGFKPVAAHSGPPAAQCRHGEMVLKSGITNKPGTPNHGKKWEGWFCGAPKGTPDHEKCPKQWVR